MNTQIFVNLPAKNLSESMKFFRKLGFTFNPQFTDETAACMIVTENIFVMLLKRKSAMLIRLKKPVMQRKARKYWYVYPGRGGRRWMTWPVKRLRRGGAHTMSRRTMGSCMGMDFRIWMA